MTTKKLPPYAKVIDDARRKGLIPARGCMGHIAIGFEWRRNIVPDFPVVVVPPERNPADYEWRFAVGISKRLLAFVQYLGQLAGVVPDNVLAVAIEGCPLFLACCD